ncbi:MAG: IS110 family transposase [Actinobacteria bacterium]|nr:IS110 family transposase [Actinomycetota bacterium]
MPDVTASLAPADVRLWVSLDVHKLSIVAATLPATGGKPEVSRIETTEKAIRRFIDRLGGSAGLAVCYEAGPGGYALWRLLTSMGVACDVVAPSLVPIRAGDRVKTDRRDAKKLVVLQRAGLLHYVAPPTAETEGLRDLLRCRDDLRCARTAARHRVAKQLLRHGRVFRDGKTLWTQKHRRWVNAQRLPDELAQLALEQMLIHLDGIERQLDTLDAKLEQIAHSERWAEPAEILTRFRGISTLTALGLIAEVGDFARFSHPRELASWLGITPSEYSSDAQQHRGHITKTGNRHARRLLVEAAWHYRHVPRRPSSGPQPDQRAWQAQVRLHHRYRHLTEHGKRSTVVNVAIARELAGFLWAAMTNQPLTTTSKQPQEVAA